MIINSHRVQRVNRLLSHLNYNHSLPKEILITVQSSYHSRLNAATVIWGMEAERREDRPLDQTPGAQERWVAISCWKEMPDRQYPALLL